MHRVYVTTPSMRLYWDPAKALLFGMHAWCEPAAAGDHKVVNSRTQQFLTIRMVPFCSSVSKFAIDCAVR